jgi:thiol-disulfide isomerase/thioredoxin
MTLGRASRVAVTLVAVTGCAVGTPPDEQSDGTAAASRVDVDTPELRRAKAEAGIDTCVDDGQRPPATEALPDVTLPCLGGGPAVDLAGLEGPAVINLFAQWCAPCREELPYYQRLHEDGGDDVRVLGIDYLDTKPDGAIELARATGVTFPLLADPDGVLRSDLRVRGLPDVVLVDADGRVAHVEYTVIRSYRQLTDLVAEHLGVSI